MVDGNGVGVYSSSRGLVCLPKGRAQSRAFHSPERNSMTQISEYIFPLAFLHLIAFDFLFHLRRVHVAQVQRWKRLLIPLALANGRKDC